MLRSYHLQSPASQMPRPRPVFCPNWAGFSAGVYAASWDFTSLLIYAPFFLFLFSGTCIRQETSWMDPLIPPPHIFHLTFSWYNFLEVFFFLTFLPWDIIWEIFSALSDNLSIELLNFSCYIFTLWEFFLLPCLFLSDLLPQWLPPSLSLYKHTHTYVHTYTHMFTHNIYVCICMLIPYRSFNLFHPLIVFLPVLFFFWLLYSFTYQSNIYWVPFMCQVLF